MDPNVVAGSSFGILWEAQNTNDKEHWLAKPLVYTIDGTEFVITTSTFNTVRIHDAKNGTLVASRQLNPPFRVSDIGCADIPDYIGITGTGVIDPATSILYVAAKGYRGGLDYGGLANGIYQLYALHLPSLEDVEDFPVLIDGHNADNDPTRYFVGGTVLQRPSLAQVNGYILAAFGGHCDMFNYTGYVAAISKTPGVGVVRNGQGHANGAIPASGRLPLSTLDECVVNFALSSSGKISLTDYFEPYDYVNLDAGDQDLGSSGVCLLDNTVFRTASVSKIAVTVGKNSKVYVMNAENLGGFKQGTGGNDAVLQTISTSTSVFGGVGSYPLEGGYFYFTPVGDFTYAYRFGTTGAGVPSFSLAGKTAFQFAGRAGIGQPTITSNNGLPGSAILWMTDVNTGLKAFRAVPDNDGVLRQITLPATPGINKFARPAFGNGRVFVTASHKIIALGAPVNLPLNCTDPVKFGEVLTGTTGTASITCIAKIAITQVDGCTTEDSRFECDNSTLPVGPLSVGNSFTFPVTWNLTADALDEIEGVSYGKIIPGADGSVLKLHTTNGVANYAHKTPISLSGNIVSADPFLLVSPGQVDFGGLVLGSASAVNGLEATAHIKNVGNSTLEILGVAWRLGTDPSTPHNNVTLEGTRTVFGEGFEAEGFPEVGDFFDAGQGLTVPIFFNATEEGTYSVTIRIWSTGGVDEVILSASAGSPPIASIAVTKDEGGWDTSFPVVLDFHSVLAGTTKTKTIQLCNVGGSVLTITKSKPPISPQLTATAPFDEFLEGQHIAVGACANATVAVFAGTVQPNRPSQHIALNWTLNTDGMDSRNPTQEFGVREIEASVTITTKQVGPLFSNGTAVYQWTGCFLDTSRNLATQVNNSTMEASNTNGQCQNLCLERGYRFAGTQYHQECWCGNTITYPSSYTSEALDKCKYACTGDASESCGGDGTYLSLYADISKFDIPGFLESANSPPPTTTTTSSAPPSTSTTPPGPGSTLNPLMPDIVSDQWKYIGCHRDNVGGIRSINSKNTADDDMTLEFCADFCEGYNFFGTEYGRECFCSWTLDTPALKVTESDCSMACASNSAQICGNGDRLTVYNNTIFQEPPPAPSHAPRAGDYAWAGCYSEATVGRALTLATTADDDMDPAFCAAFCEDSDYMGVEYGRECFCGNTLEAGSTLQATGDCNMLCAGNAFQFCGAGGRLDLYTFSPIVASSTSSSVSSSASSLSVLTSSSAESSSAPSSSSSIASSSSIPSSVSASTTSSEPPPSSSSTFTGPTATATNGYYHVGCYSDRSDGHALPLIAANNSMTPELCIAVANSIYDVAPTPTARLPYVFIEYHHECYGGASFDFEGSAVSTLVGPHACTDYCYGSVSTFTTNGVVSTTTDLTNRCGGPKQFNLYVLSTPVDFPTTGGPIETVTPT
ncbi:hypothetical protein OQA88_4165 [Cercophora sp. LCS_1]